MWLSGWDRDLAVIGVVPCPPLTSLTSLTSPPHTHLRPESSRTASWLVCPACKDDDVTILTAPVAGDASKKNLQCNVCCYEWIDDPETPNAAGL